MLSSLGWSKVFLGHSGVVCVLRSLQWVTASGFRPRIKVRAAERCRVGASLPRSPPRDPRSRSSSAAVTAQWGGGVLNNGHCFVPVAQAGRSGCQWDGGSRLADGLLPTVCLDGGRETHGLGPLTRTLTPSWCPHGRGPSPSHLLLHLTLGVGASLREFEGHTDTRSMAAGISGRGGWSGSPRGFVQESRLGLCWFLSAVSTTCHRRWGATGAGAGC